jgi:hypothetical protein
MPFVQDGHQGRRAATDAATVSKKFEKNSAAAQVTPWRVSDQASTSEFV